MKPETRFDDCCQAFAESYEISNLPAVREVERTVLGCDYGGTSWTTSTQAAQIVEMLHLHAGVQLLEVGAGSGWPGVHLADASGCDVTLVDLPINALAMARQRARADGIEDRVRQIAASGSALPFRNGCFAAISHSDVLYCMPQKTEMPRECRRVAADRAKIADVIERILKHLKVWDPVPKTAWQQRLAAGACFERDTAFFAISARNPPKSPRTEGFSIGSSQVSTASHGNS